MTQTTNILKTDVLVIAGGIAGLCAANKAVDEGVDVIIADKAVMPWTGQAPTSGGFFDWVKPEGIERDVEWTVKECEYLNDQDFLYTVRRDTRPFIQELADWGLPIKRDFDGNLKQTNGGPIHIDPPQYILPPLLGRVLKKGAKVLNRVFIADLIKQDGNIIGAVGFNSQTGEMYVIQSKATILASGGCNYKSRRTFHTNCGEGIAMAYDAGAEMRNAEFANTFMVANKFTETSGGRLAPGVHFYENALGENMAEKYPDLDPIKLDPAMPPWRNGMVFKRYVTAFYKEIEAGRGPIYLSFKGHPEMVAAYGPGTTINERAHGYANMMTRLGFNVIEDKVEWIPRPEFHAGPVRVDHLNCETTIPRLYATGDIVQNGSAFLGAREACGLPMAASLSFCVSTGFRAGTAAGKAVASAPEPKVSKAEVEKARQELFAPLDVKEGYSPYDGIKEVQEVVFKLKNSYIKSKDRLEAALAKIENVKDKLQNVKAKDSHELVRCHEAKAMALSAELLFRASLMRTETRGTNIREDFPERDDKNWLKWIIIKKENGKMKLRTEPVPIEKYKYKP